MDDRFSRLRRAVEESLSKPGHVDPDLRKRAAEGRDLPPDLKSFIRAIHDHAYQITDEQVAELRKSYSDDALLELIAAAAVGAAGMRLDRGLAVIAGRKK